MPLGHHLGAHQHIHFAAVHAGQLGLQAAFFSGGVGIHAGHAQGLPVGPHFA